MLKLYLYQQLDALLSATRSHSERWSKALHKREIYEVVYWRSSKWYIEESAVGTEEIMVDLRLTVIKLLHATWLIELFNHLSSCEGSSHIANGWEKAGISSIVSGETKLPLEDPFSNLKI